MLRFVALVFALSVSSSLVAQSEVSDTPRTMLQFLKQGDLVGVQSIDGTTSVVISTYTKDRFAIAKQIASRGRSMMNAKQIADSNELIRKEYDNYVSRRESAGVVEDKLMVMPLIRTSLGTIVGSGDDYVMIKFEGEPRRRCVIPEASIGKIYLDANPIRFFGPRDSTTSKDG